MSKPKFTNELILESSPYLLQHAHNPVNWKAWNENTLLQARKENKLLLISIGYATCHWCHVMEAESFENEEVAALMNQHFICIKIDREERPDVDQVYMDAVQILTGRGGWPLNCIALPDGKPFWGGTYFPKKNWMGILTEISRIWEQEPDKINEHAENLTQGIQQKDLIPLQTEINIINFQIIKNIVDPWEKQFDYEFGGMNRAPKFPLPNNYHFLLRFSIQSGNQELLDFVQLTLTKMAFGGIYDHIRGGFSRYSTDVKWHVPHFEKMLYDNAQLVSLYSEAYLATKNPLYKEVVKETLQFIENELYDTKTGGFYAALDADSINDSGVKEEGAYYFWDENELQNILGKDYDIFTKYYNINPFGHWEHGHYVLIKNQTDESFKNENHLDPVYFQNLKENWKQKLRKKQSERERPILDDKILTSWNALMLKGYCDAYRVFGYPEYLEIAQKNAEFLWNNLLRPDGGLNRNYKNGVSKINAFIEDYAAFIDALLSLHEVTLDEIYLHQAKTLTDYTLEHFFDSTSGFFFFTSDEDMVLIHRKIDFADNVISSGNSMMARNLFKMSHLFGNENYENICKNMLNNVIKHCHVYPSSYTNWLFLATDLATDFYEIVITGPQAKSKLMELHSFYIPNKLITGNENPSEMVLLKNRFDEVNTRIFVCVNKICQLPTEDLTTALNQIKIHF